MDEFEFIGKIAKGVPRSAEGLILGIDDDAAVIEGRGRDRWLVTTDISAEDVHFKRTWAGWDIIGKKTLLTNVSDILAMGGLPWFYFVSIAVPKNVREKDLLKFYDGMSSVAKEYNMIMAGGDTTASVGKFFASITVIGSAENVITRSGAKAGDKIFVSGSLGGSEAGLYILEKDLKGNKALIDKHLLPTPRLKLARWLSEKKCASAMIDISDGLVQDLTHIADLSRVGFNLYAENIPIDENIKSLRSRVNPLLAAISGGEDYELLFTMNEEQRERFEFDAAKIDFGCPITMIGEIVEDKTRRRVIDSRGKLINVKKKGFAHQIGGK